MRRLRSRCRPLVLSATLFASASREASGDSLVCGPDVSIDCVWQKIPGPLSPEDPRCTRLKHQEVAGHEYQILAAALQGLPDLQELHLEGLHLGDEGVAAIAISLGEGWLPNLEKLYIAHNDMGIDGARALAKALSALPQLRVLNLPENLVRNLGAQAISEALQKGDCPLLEQLVIAGNGLGIQGAREIARAMAFLPRLKDLHIARNGIGTMGAVFIAKEMKDGNAQELEWLSMGNNLIGDMGTQALSIVLEMCPRLEWLDLPQNSISDVGAMALGKAVEYLGRKLSLRELDLRGNQISPFGQESLETGKLELPELQFWLAALPGEPGSLAVQAMPEPSNDVDTVHRVVLGNSWSITADY